MRTAGIKVKANVTYRPVERSYLMHYAFNIAKGKSPVGIEKWPSVNIDWEHRKADGTPDVIAAIKAAVQMCEKYGLKINSAKQKVTADENSNPTIRDKQLI